MVVSRPTSPTDVGGGDARTAQKLLKPRRRQQIEIWLDEAVRWEQSQSCAVGKSFDHVPEDPPSSSPPQESGVSKSAPPCQVCGRHFTGDEVPSPVLSAAAGRPPDKDSKPGRTRQMFRGVVSAMSSLRNTASDDRRDGEWDPSLLTRMFLVEAANDGDSNSTSAASRFDSSDGGKQALDGRMARLKRAQKLLEKSQPKVG
ncbi:hypothetical protein VP1G_01337 [Cytospora mali]|uniref:Uncharacterized protein n=1 Tax=Cytospora mali TaxID=578113 RepID=A0A194UQK6_CYTMA|nr:hypothetical protein VP1G_01337 [Valsa mali var. pyri (nom. inval.)]